MSGHSKWSTIKRKKEKTDSQKAKIFTKIGREIIVAVKSGGADSSTNSKLKELISKAKSNNVPSDNIDRLIRKAAGESSDTNYEGILYEGYGPAGIAVMVETLTDNRNRTAGEVRHYFDKYLGNMGQSGSVSFQFDKFGLIIIEKNKISEDTAMEDALECGAIDFISDEKEIFEIRTEPKDFLSVCEGLEDKGYSFLSSEIAYIPKTYVKLTSEEDIKNMTKMLDMFEDNDDVQSVWHNWEEE